MPDALPPLRLAHHRAPAQDHRAGLPDLSLWRVSGSFNERTGTPFNFLEYPTDIVLLVVLWRLRYKLSLHDLAEMVLERGFVFTHEAMREWKERFAPLLTECLRAKRPGKAGRSWDVDETSIKGHDGPRSVVLPVPCHRSQWQLG